MNVINPIPTTDALLIGSNVPDCTTAEWVGVTQSFVNLQQNGVNWVHICAAPNGDIYAAAYGGDIYKQTAGTGNFVALSQTPRNWYSMCAAPNGDIYASKEDVGGQIYKRALGTGDFTDLSQTNRSWRGLCAQPDGDIYCCVSAGDIYKRTEGAGNFSALGQTSRAWKDMCAALNGDVYACVGGSGDIYKQTAGTGNFVATDDSIQYWRDICVAPNGDVYACINGAIYKKTYCLIYSIGESVLRNHIIYESIINNNQNNDPALDDQDSPTHWLKTEYDNKWRMFNNILGSQTENATKIEYIRYSGGGDCVSMQNIVSDTVDIVEIDLDAALLNETAWTGATGTTQSTGWNKVGTPSNYTIDDGMIRITADAGSEGQRKTIAVTPGTEYQLIGLYKNTSGDVAQYGVYDNTHSTNILATTDLANATANASFSHVFTAPAGCTSVEIKLMAKANTDIVWFDFITLAPTVYSETVTTGTTKKNATKTDIPVKSNGIITTTINYSGTAKIGELIVGSKFYIGVGPLEEAQGGFTNYSDFSENTFGEVELVARSYSKKLSFDVDIDYSDIDSVYDFLCEQKDTMMLYLGSETYGALQIYGFCKEPVITYHPTYCTIALETRGVI